MSSQKKERTLQTRIENVGLYIYKQQVYHCIRKVFMWAGKIGKKQYQLYFVRSGGDIAEAGVDVMPIFIIFIWKMEWFHALNLHNYEADARVLKIMMMDGQ